MVQPSQETRFNPNLPHLMSAPFTVIVTRQSNPTDGTNGWHGKDFRTRDAAISYALLQTLEGCERAVVIQHTVIGQRRIATFKA